MIDVGTLETGAPYIVMEHLSGVDLGEWSRSAARCRSPTPSSACCRRAANLFLTTRSDGSPCVKILDLGISKVKTQDNQGLTKTQGIDHRAACCVTGHLECGGTDTLICKTPGCPSTKTCCSVTCDGAGLTCATPSACC